MENNFAAQAFDLFVQGGQSNSDGKKPIVLNFRNINKKRQQ